MRKSRGKALRLIALPALLMLVIGILFRFSSTYSSSSENKKAEARKKLGHLLFFDRRLSLNQAKSCSSCHDPKFAFTDGYKKSIGIQGDVLTRNSQTLINVKALKSLTWIRPELHSIEKQMEIPLFGTSPVEMGMDKNDNEILSRLKKDERYQNYFAQAYPEVTDPFMWEYIQHAIGEYLRNLNSYQSKFDKHTKNPEKYPFTKSETKGMALFFSEELKCGVCHPPPHFTLAANFNLDTDTFYNNIGLYNIGGKGDYPPQEQGLYAITGKPSDKGRFRIPPLRNLAFTAPYMHNGSIWTLEEVIKIFAEGGLNTEEPPYTGDGRKNPFKHRLITGFSITAEEQRNLADFLLTLTDSSILVNPLFQDPFKEK